MLQQTQVSRVEGYYLRFLERYPTVESLARSEPAMVREAWAGLGYYRRAANLHRLARTVVDQHGGVIPPEPERLVALPGIGRYTAGAVASFAYERATPAIDTNVARVSAAPSTPGFRPGGRNAGCGKPAPRSCPGETARRPGRSTRQSWSSAR
jgi:A/G-specific DNA glycosylase